MFQWIILLIALLFGQTNAPKNDLRKKETRTLTPFRTILLFIIIFLCFIGFIILCFTVVGASGTESGVVYNHMGDVI